MALVIRVRFKRASKFYDFDPNGLELHHGMRVITETARGVEMGECMSGVMDVPDERLVLPLKPVIRIATEQDLEIQRRNEQSEKEAFDIALERIADHKLEMKLVDVEYAFDHSKIIFYFTANGRVDFRMLVKNLASIFKTRIELRQIGVRDEAKMLGGIGPCGRPICCRSFLSDFTPVSIKMAKEQNLSLNPAKISGLCDRLMCCLKYEQDHYEATHKRMPRVGREILTPDGMGTIHSINVLSETVRVRVAVGDSFELREYSIDDCTRVGQEARPAAPREARVEGGEPQTQEREAPACTQEEPGTQAPIPPEERPAREDRPPRPARSRGGERRERGERPGRQERPVRSEAMESRQRPNGGQRRPDREDRPQELPPQAKAQKTPDLPEKTEPVPMDIEEEEILLLEAQSDPEDLL